MSAPAWPTNVEVPTEGDESITSVLVKFQQQHKIPGCAAAIVKSSGLISSGCSGWRKLGDPTPVTIRDTWHLGSDTKAMTSTLAAVLVEQELINWETTVGEIFDNAPECWQKVTLDHLLCHVSGATPNIDWHRHDKQPNRDSAVEEIFNKTTLASAPGEKYCYSNVGYCLAGAMLEKVSGGTSWEQLLKEHVWKELGISSDAAGFGGTGTLGKVDQPWPHKNGVPCGNGPLVDNGKALGPAGTAHMPIQDWALFIADQLRGARKMMDNDDDEEEDSLLLCPSSYKHLLTGWKTNPAYARGWITAERSWGKGTVYSHAGSNTMNYCVAWMAPNIDGAILICCNEGEGAKFCDEVVGALLPKITS